MSDSITSSSTDKVEELPNVLACVFIDTAGVCSFVFVKLVELIDDGITKKKYVPLFDVVSYNGTISKPITEMEIGNIKNNRFRDNKYDIDVTQGYSAKKVFDKFKEYDHKWWSPSDNYNSSGVFLVHEYGSALALIKFDIDDGNATIDHTSTTTDVAKITSDDDKAMANAGLTSVEKLTSNMGTKSGFYGYLDGTYYIVAVKLSNPEIIYTIFSNWAVPADGMTTQTENDISRLGQYLNEMETINEFLSKIPENLEQTIQEIIDNRAKNDEEIKKLKETVKKTYLYRNKLIEDLVKKKEELESKQKGFSNFFNKNDTLKQEIEDINNSINNKITEIDNIDKEIKKKKEENENLQFELFRFNLKKPVVYFPRGSNYLFGHEYWLFFGTNFNFSLYALVNEIKAKIQSELGVIMPKLEDIKNKNSTSKSKMPLLDQKQPELLTTAGRTRKSRKSKKIMKIKKKYNRSRKHAKKYHRRTYRH